MQRQIIITCQPPEIGAGIRLKGLAVNCQSACFQTPSLIHHSHWTAHQTDGQLVITMVWCWEWGLAKTLQSHWWGCQHGLFYYITLHMGVRLIKLTNDIKNFAIGIARALLEKSKKKVSKRVCALGLLASRGGGSRGGGYNTKQLYGLEIVKWYSPPCSLSQSRSHYSCLLRWINLKLVITSPSQPVLHMRKLISLRVS